MIPVTVRKNAVFFLADKETCLTLSRDGYDRRSMQSNQVYL